MQVLQFLHGVAQKISGQDLYDVTLLHEALSLSARALHVSARALFHQLPARLAPFLKLGVKGEFPVFFLTVNERSSLPEKYVCIRTAITLVKRLMLYVTTSEQESHFKPKQNVVSLISYM